MISRSTISDDSNLYRRQFLLTSRPGFKFPWPSVAVKDYTLYHHPEIEYTSVKIGTAEIHLVGEIFDWQNPACSNSEILDFLVSQESTQEMLSVLSRFSGHFLLICGWNDQFFLLNDACAQYGVYYDEACTVFGSQMKIMGEVLELNSNQDPSAVRFFNSTTFQKKNVFVGDSTHIESVFHLRPNHLIDLKDQKQRRFFPVTAIKPMSVKEAAEKTSRMIKGYVEAIAARHQIAVAVTAGYDSRLLYLASLDQQAKYFISQHSNMSDSHVDIKVARRLTEIFDRQLEVVKDVPEDENWPSDVYSASIDLPRKLNQMSREYNGYVCLNGNCSEIARNYFGSVPFPTAVDLARMIGYHNEPFAINACNSWLTSNAKVFENAGFHLLDMFYWEEKMGNWGAKKRAETNAIGRIIYSPTNSRGLMETCLSVPRKYRDAHNNRLFKEMIRNLAEDKELPEINPFPKAKIIALLKKTGFYQIYQFLGLKSGLLKY